MKLCSMISIKYGKYFFPLQDYQPIERNGFRALMLMAGSAVEHMFVAQATIVDCWIHVIFQTLSFLGYR